MGDLCDLSVTPETFDAQKEDREIQDLRAGNAVQRVRGGDQATAVRNHRPAAAGNGSFPDRRSAPVELAAPWGSHEIGTIGTTRSAAPYGGRRSGVVSAAGRGCRSGASDPFGMCSADQLSAVRNLPATIFDTLRHDGRHCPPARMHADAADCSPWKCRAHRGQARFTAVVQPGPVRQITGWEELAG